MKGGRLVLLCRSICVILSLQPGVRSLLGGRDNSFCSGVAGGHRNTISEKVHWDFSRHESIQ